MEKGTTDQSTGLTKPARIIITEIDQKTQRIDIPREGFSMKGSFTLFVILFWLMMILIWTILLSQYGIVWTLLSIPLWLLGIVTLRLSLKMIFASQQLTVDENGMTIIKNHGGKTASVSFSRQEIKDIFLVEGSYRTFSGITRKGVYPAVISNEQAYAFGERCSNSEKQWLLETVKKSLNFK